MNASLARVVQSLFLSNFLNQYLRLFRILLILEPFIRDGDNLGPGTKLLSDFRVIMVVLCTCDLMR